MFNVGDLVLNNSGHKLEIVAFLKDGRYLVKNINNAHEVEFESDLHLLKSSICKPASFKMNLALEQTLKEIAKHLDDDNYTLIESVTNHDYHEAAGKHHITLNIVLKENK